MMKKLLYSIGVGMAMWILASCSQEVKYIIAQLNSFPERSGSQHLQSGLEIRLLKLDRKSPFES